MLKVVLSSFSLSIFENRGIDESMPGENRNPKWVTTVTYPLQYNALLYSQIYLLNRIEE